MNIRIFRKFVTTLGIVLLSVAAFCPQSGSAASISQIPLFVTTQVPPNIVLTLDESGSMAWAYVPDALGGNGSGIVWCGDASSCPTPTTTTVTPCDEWNYGWVYSHHSWHYEKTTCKTYGTPYTTTTYGAPYQAGWLPADSVYIPDTWHFKSSAFNPLYYDPTVTYTPPNDTDGKTPLTTSFTAAYIDGFVHSRGTINLATDYEATVQYTPGRTYNDEVNSCNYFDYSSSGWSTGLSCDDRHNAGDAFYYTYDNRDASGHCADGDAPSLTDDSCYTKHLVSATSGPGGTDERQNFAIWYSFYRIRNLTTISGANLAFSSLDQTYRVAWQDLDNGSSYECAGFASSGCNDWTGSHSFDNRIGIFTDNSSSTQKTHRTDFFTWLSHLPASNGTPLRAALNTVGQYYSTTGVNSPYAYNPQNVDSPELVCRPNYAILMTDGLWNGSTPSSPSFGDADSKTVTLPDGTVYNPQTPYKDSTSQTLADIAFYYWSHNLAPSLGTSSALQFMPYNQNVTVKDSVGNIGNLAPYWNPQNDPASWPHMVTFTVGLGMTSTMASAPSGTTAPVWGGTTYSGGYNDLITGNNAWPPVSGSSGGSSNNVWDLWHAAIDSRGQFFSADHPQDVVAAFSNIVKRITGRVGSSSAIAVNSTRLNADTQIYQAQFNSADWSGQVLAYSISSTNGSVSSSPVWQATDGIPAFPDRKIYTWNDTSNAGTTFYDGTKTTAQNFANLSSGEQTALDTQANGTTTDSAGPDRLAYLAGDQSKELANGGNFRNRKTLLGDIVNSNPDYVGNSEDYGFSSLNPEGSSYSSFLTSTKASRVPMLYVGANDGMLHALNANTGAEVFAYVPRGVYSNLSQLPDPGYGHHYFVDGSPQSVDTYFNSGWHTLLAGSTGAGGRDVFLLDVTSPTSFTATNVLWDYDGVDGTTSGASLPDNDLGYTIGQPTIARFHDGDWYMIFGNGYNSTNGDAVLYMYNINTKTLRKFDTKVGTSGVSGTGTPNGLSSPIPVDYNNDRITDAIYAGDLQGNLWKLDVSSSNSANWGFALKTGDSPSGNPVPLFQAHDDSGNLQPITERPQVGLDNTGRVMVYFGTGTYYQVGDNTVPSNPAIQSFYGIVDTQSGKVATNVVTRSTDPATNQLLQQTILSQQTVSGTPYRITSDNQMTSGQEGWYIDLYYKDASNNVTDPGERVVSEAVLSGGRIIFTTVIPEGDACQYGGTSWLMEMDSSTGSRLTNESPFDLDGNNKIDNSDLVTITNPDGTTSVVAVSGKQSNVGIIQTPGIISAGEIQYKYYSGSTGKIGETVESASSSQGGRLSWQQLLPKQ